MAENIRKVVREELHAQSSDKPNSRVTKRHIDQMREAMAFAMDSKVDGYQRLGYLSYAIASILRDVGYPESHGEISKRMWDNYGRPAAPGQ